MVGSLCSRRLWLVNYELCRDGVARSVVGEGCRICPGWVTFAWPDPVRSTTYLRRLTRIGQPWVWFAIWVENDGCVRAIGREAAALARQGSFLGSAVPDNPECE